MARRLLLLLDGILLVAAVFLGVRLYETLGARPRTAPAESPPASSAETAASPVTVPPVTPLAAYATVAERNLFSPSRTETAPEPPRAATGAGAPGPPPPKPRLYGIVLLPEGRGRAYLEDAQRRRVFAYSVGDIVGGARLEQIKTDRVVLSRGGETFEVLLYDPTKPRQSAGPSSVQSPLAGGAGRPPVGRSPGPVPSPVPGLRVPGRPQVVVPPPAPPPGGEAQEQPTEEE